MPELCDVTETSGVLGTGERVECVGTRRGDLLHKKYSNNFLVIKTRKLYLFRFLHFIYNIYRLVHININIFFSYTGVSQFLFTFL